MSVKLRTLLILLSFFTFFHTSQAADTWHIGTSEPFIQQYLQDLNIQCQDCPTNVSPRSLNTVANTVLDMAGRRHVGLFRDGIVLNQLEPGFAGDSSNYQYIDQVIDTYAGYNTYLILTFGQPLPSWMLVSGGSDWCFMPSDSASYATLKNNMAWAIGRYIKHLYDANANNPNFITWLNTHLYIEPFNEFDAIQSIGCQGTQYSTADRAASLEDGLEYIWGTYGIHLQMLMPSIVTMDAAGMKQWITNYYNSSGLGLPNIHLYPTSNTTATNYTSAVSGAIQTIAGGVPLAMQGKIVLGETAPPAYDASLCTSGMTASERDWVFKDLAADPTIASNTLFVGMWRTLDIVNPSDCQSLYGIMSADASGYHNAGINLFSYLTGTDQSQPNAAFVSQSVPTTMQTGHQYSVSIIMQNTGTTPWTYAGAYKLGSQNPGDSTWGANRVYLNSGESIGVGQNRTFNFTVTAPTTAGIYNFQWKMVEEGVKWFGATSTNVSVTVQ